MTTDNFTEAARAEAERRFDFLSDASCFEQGAEWARTHLAAQEESVLMTSREETISDRLSDAGYTEYAEDEDGGVTWVSAPLGEVLRIVSAAQEPTDGERAVRALHRQFGVYEHEDDCPDTSDEHREAHHHGDSDGNGEGYCDQRPLYTLCDHCRDESGERLDWPCATIQELDSTRAARRDEETR